MDNQNQKSEQPAANTVAQPAAPALSPLTPAPQPTDKPKLEVSDTVAQSLLMIDGMQDSNKKKLRLPLGLLVSIAVVIVLLFAASYMISSTKPNKNKTNTNGSQSTDSNSVSNQINQDVQSCSNVVNAVSQC